MKKCLLFLLLLTTSGLVRTMAQVPAEEQQGDPSVMRPRIERLKITYIGQRLNLTPEESKHFWPVYFQYENELRGAQANLGLDQIAKEEAILNIRKRYLNQFTNLIGRNRATYVFQLEHDFTQMLIKRLNKANPRMGMRRGF